MAIDGGYLKAKRTEFGLDQDCVAEILGCTCADVVNYENYPDRPLETAHAERLLRHAHQEDHARTNGVREVLEQLHREIGGECHSFSPNKIMAHPRKLMELMADESGLSVTPFLVEIHLTNSCDHHCPKCTFAQIRRDPGLNRRSLDTGRAKSLLDELHEFGVRAVFWSGGGEPLQHPSAEEVFRHAAAKGFKQVLITNGSHLDQVDTSFLVRNFSTVRISLDAQTDSTFAKTHGFVRSDALDQFTKIQSNIKRLVKTWKETPPTDRHPDINQIGVGVSFLLRETNKDEIAGFCTLAGDGLGVQYAEIKPLVHERNSENAVQLKSLLTLDLIESLRLVRTQHNDASTFKVFTLEHKFLDMISDSRGKAYQRCWGHPLYPAIAANGAVFPCCLMLGRDELCYGNVNDRTFREIWAGEQRRESVARIDASSCPINCKLSETNKTLEAVMRARRLPLPEFLN